MQQERNSSLDLINSTTYGGELHENTLHDSNSGELKIVMTLLYCITFLTGLVGNSLGLYIVCRKCGIKAATHLLIANLACSNLLITIIVMPMSISYLYNQHRWHAGLAGTITCKLSQFLFMFPIAASILTILVVSIDRFFAVFFPMRGQLFRKPKTMTATVWICSAILVSPAFVIFRAVLFPAGEWRCVTYFGQDEEDAIFLTKVYFIAIFILLYLLPLLIITVLYTLIGWKLHHRKVPGQRSGKTFNMAAEKSKRKIVKVLVMIVATFTLCWFPAHIIHYYAIFESDDYEKLPSYLHPLLLWISHTNSSIDPCLYILLSQNFRSAFRSVLKRYGFFQKRKQLENRISRLASNFSLRRNRGSGFWSFRKTEGYQPSEGGKRNAHWFGMLPWSPTEDRKFQRQLRDHAL